MALDSLPSVPPLRPAEASYLATSTWETYAAGTRHTTTISRSLAVQVQPTAQGLALLLEAAPPTLQATTDPEPLTELARQLADLYARLELLLTPAGTVAGLLNYDTLRQAGEQHLAALQAAADPDDQLTATMLAFASRQLASPETVLRSLAFDYLYQLLLPGLGGQLAGATQPRQLAGFFDKIPLWFAEQATLGPEVDGQVALHLTGPLDATRTDLPAVQRQLAAMQHLAAPAGSALPELPVPHFYYEAAYSLELATGLPQHAQLTVYARAGELLNKEYYLTLARQ